jgi:hypothetical protein
MKTLPRRGAPRPAPGGPGEESPGSNPLLWAASVLAVAFVALLVMGFYLWIYPRRGFRVPLGWDTARYVWRTSLVRDLGFRELTVDPARPGFPAVVGSLASVLGTSPLRLAAMVPALGAAATALAAGVFVGVAFNRPLWQMGLIAVGTGTSFFVVRLAGPQAYQDNMLAAGILMAASTAIVLAVEHRRGVIPAIVLLGAGAVAHWAFFLVIAAVVGIGGAAYLPSSMRTWRRGSEPLLDTPTGRLGQVLGGGAAIGGAWIFGLLGAGIRAPIQNREEFAQRFSRTLPVLRLSVTGPAAALGAASLVPAALGDDEPARRSRFGLMLVLAWCAVVLMGILANLILHLRSPAHRFLSFAIVVPVLGLLGLLWVGGVVARLVPWRRVGPVVGALVVAGGLSWATVEANSTWSANHPWFSPAKVQASATADAYLSAAGVDPAHPIVFVNRLIDPSSTALNSHVVRIGLSPRRILHSYVYAGAPESYVARTSTESPAQPARSEISKRYLARIPFEQDPVALILQPYNTGEFKRWTGLHPDRVVAPGLAVVEGPVRAWTPPLPLAMTPFSYLGIGAMALGALAAIAIVGLGWSLAFFGRRVRPVEVVALAPSVGIAVLILGSVLLDRVGLRLSGATGVAIVLVVATAGWVVAVTRDMGRTPIVRHGRSRS